MEAVYIPGKLQLKNCLGLKRMKRQMGKMCKMKTSNNDSGGGGESNNESKCNSNVVLLEQRKKSERECNDNSKEVELKEEVKKK